MYPELEFSTIVWKTFSGWVIGVGGHSPRRGASKGNNNDDYVALLLFTFDSLTRWV